MASTSTKPKTSSGKSQESPSKAISTKSDISTSVPQVLPPSTQPAMESTGTQFPSLSRRGNLPLQNCTNTIKLDQESSTMESTGTQFPSLSRRGNPLQNRTNNIELNKEPLATKPVAMVAPQARASTGPTQVTSSRASHQQQHQHQQQPTANADMDAMLVEYLVNNPPDSFSETTDTLSITSDDDFTLTDDEGKILLVLHLIYASPN